MTTDTQSMTRETPNESSSAVDDRTHQGSLRSKLVLSLAAVFFLFLTIDELVRQRVIQPEFKSLEESGAIRDANRVLAALNSEVEHLTVLAEHWATQIRESELIAVTDGLWNVAPTHDHLDWAATITGNGAWNWRLDDGRTHASIEAEEAFASLLQLCRKSGRQTSSGMTRVGSQSLVLFSLIRLAPEEFERPYQSEYLLVAKKVDGELIEELRRQTQVQFALQPPRKGTSDQKLVIWQANESTLVVEVQLVGWDNKKLANVYIEVPRDVMARSEHITRMARNLFVFGSAAALLLLLFLMQKIVISPLTAIRKHSDLVAEKGLNTDPLVLNGNDEIGELATAFDKMVQRLSDTQTKLTQASQAAGRSEVASTVIHNVGNVLTNVNSLIDAACDRTDRLRIAPLNKLASRLRSGEENFDMLKATPDYLEGLAGSLQSDQQSINELLDTLSDNVRHIHDVISAQREHTDQSLEISAIRLGDLINESIACSMARLDEDSVRVTVEGQVDVEIDCDRSLLLQTMINLIGNAHHAMRQIDPNIRDLNIAVRTNQRSVQIDFRDNGCGMTTSTLERVFDAHFTTREGGTGLGLHFCAITLKRLGGSIHADSEGLGKGSVFSIEVPRSPIDLDPARSATASGTTI